MRLSEEAVQAKTGKIWGDWLKILNEAGARTMNHNQIVAHLAEHYQAGPY